MPDYLKGQTNSDLTDGLTSVLADTFVLYFKTHAYHWNVTGPRFKALHEMFEEQYTELWNATDEIAERVRTLGAFLPGAYKDLLPKARLQEGGNTPDADAMVKTLAEDNRKIVDLMYPVLRIAQDAGDEASADLLIGRINVHEKAAWMLESSIKS